MSTEEVPQKEEVIVDYSEEPEKSAELTLDLLDKQGELLNNERAEVEEQIKKQAEEVCT